MTSTKKSANIQDCKIGETVSIPSDNFDLSRLIFGMSKEEHFRRNELCGQNELSLKVPSLEALKKNPAYQDKYGNFSQDKFDKFWSLEKISTTHNIGKDIHGNQITGNKSYRYIGDGSDGFKKGIQLVYDSNEKLVTSPENGGTWAVNGIFCNLQGKKWKMSIRAI